MLIDRTDIIAISYHRPNDFKICIDSILKNTIMPYKLTIIDNSCGGLDSLLNYYETIDHINIIRNKTNLGKGASFKKHYESINKDSKLFVSLDADIEVPHMWLSKLYKRVITIDRLGALSPVLTGKHKYKTFEEQLRNNHILMHGGKKGYHEMMKIADGLYHTQHTAGPLLLINGEFFDEIGGYPGDKLFGHDDGFLCKKSIEMNRFIGFTSDVSCIHHQNDNEPEYAKWKRDNLNKDRVHKGHWDR